MDTDSFCQEKLGLSSKLGALPQERMNAWGGSLALGHPFGATGVRLMMQAAQRMIYEDKTTALLSACAQTGQGAAMLLERHPDATF